MRDDFDFNVTFCNLIENNPVIYNYNRPDYCNRSVQDQAWSIIARTLNETVTDCKARWANIRNRYGKYNKSKLLPSGSAAKVLREYYLAPHLTFLDGYLKSRRSKSNLPTDPVQTDDSDAGEDSMSPYQPPSLTPSPRTERHPSPLSVSSSKQGRTITLKEVNQSAYDYFTSKRRDEKKDGPLDTDLSFLQSMLPEMKAMNVAQKRRFKMGVMQLATQILDENEATSTSTSTSNIASSACISQFNTVPYYTPAPPIQQTFQNVADPATPQQTIKDIAPPSVINTVPYYSPAPTIQQTFQNVADPAAPQQTIKDIAPPSVINTVPYYAPAPPIQQTFQNVADPAAPQQTIKNIAPPSVINTGPYYAPAPPIQQTFQNVADLAAPQQPIKNIAPPSVIQHTIQNNPQHACQNIASPASPRNVASSSGYQHFEDCRQDENTYFNLPPYSVISASSTHMRNTQCYNNESPSSNNLENLK